MAASSVSLLRFSSFASRFRLLPAINHRLYLTFKTSPFSREFSSLEEGKKAPKYVASQELQLSDSCVKVRLCKKFPILQTNWKPTIVVDICLYNMTMIPVAILRLNTNRIIRPNITTNQRTSVL